MYRITQHNFSFVTPFYCLKNSKWGGLKDVKIWRKSRSEKKVLSFFRFNVLIGNVIYRFYRADMDKYVASTDFFEGCEC